ncbi:ATP-binding protein [Streptomyces sp. B6B3]|uniref:AAA family ATPase n=1 Tax=Streptomyces sp. B6B3 TaxID=3153570 RepID=UPI00325ED90F
MTTLLLMVGLPGAGKTTRARQLAKEHNALRLTPDEWMIPLFGELVEADGRRDVLEGRLLWLALEALRLGTNVVLDYGCWSRDERSAIRWLAADAGASCRLVYVPVDQETQLARIAHREATTPDQTFPISEADVLRWRTLFDEPDDAELGVREVAGPPPGWPSWREWATDRWPSFA